MTSSVWTPQNAIPPHLKSLIQSSNSPEKLILSFLQIISLLKKQRRTGWVDFNVENCESISDHMYRMGVITTILPDKVTNILSSEKEIVDLNKSRCCQIAIVHDMAESLVGDITPRDATIDKKEKHRRELAAMEYLTKELIEPYNPQAASLVMSLWLEYENISTIEARYVKDIDKFEMMLQAFEYEKEHKGKNFESFFEAVPAVKTKEVKSLVDEMMKDREVFWKSS